MFDFLNAVKTLYPNRDSLAIVGDDDSDAETHGIILVGPLMSNPRFELIIKIDVHEDQIVLITHIPPDNPDTPLVRICHLRIPDITERSFHAEQFREILMVLGQLSEQVADKTPTRLVVDIIQELEGLFIIWDYATHRPIGERILDQWVLDEFI